MTFIKTAAVAATCSLLAISASADTIVLDFEGVNSAYPSGDFANINDFYDGGSSSDGETGTDFGVGFSDNALAICLNTPGESCSNTSRGGLGNPDSQLGGLFFLDGAETFMNVAAGFDTGFSFFYTAISDLGSVSVFDGLNGTGNLLATLNLDTTTSDCGPDFNADFCPFVAAGTSFVGTAMSVAFAGVANQIVFDDVTFGSVTPDPVSPVPVPASLPLLLAGFAGLAGLRRSRRNKV